MALVSIAVLAYKFWKGRAKINELKEACKAAIKANKTLRVGPHSLWGLMFQDQSYARVVVRCEAGKLAFLAKTSRE